MSARRFWIATVASALGLAVTGSAAVWQFHRGQEKDRVVSEAEAGAKDPPIAVGPAAVPESAVRYRRVTVSGRFRPETRVLQDNQTRGSQHGYVVYEALDLGGGVHVVVKRGWVAGLPDRSTLPAVRSPDGTVTLEGMALPPASRFLELAPTELAGPVWQNVTVERYAQRFRRNFQPLIVEQTTPLSDDLVRDWPKPASGSSKNYGYAFQWASMAALIMVFYGYSLYRRARPRPPAQGPA